MSWERELLEKTDWVPPPKAQPITDDTKFGSGAVRSGDASLYRFDLISPLAKLALARTYAEGAFKYGELNMELGMPIWDLYNHADWHLTMYFAGDRSEPHLAHALWGVAMMIHSEEMWPHLNSDNLRGPGCTLTEALKKRLDDTREFLAKRRKENPQPEWSMDDLPEVQKLRKQREDLSNDQAQ